MKNLKQVILPAVIILMGAGAAFATQVDKKSNALVDGYRIDPNTLECIDIKKECSTTGSMVCTWSDGVASHELYELGETLCEFKLFEP